MKGKLVNRYTDTIAHLFNELENELTVTNFRLLIGGHVAILQPGENERVLENETGWFWATSWDPQIFSY